MPLSPAALRSLASKVAQLSSRSLDAPATASALAALLPAMSECCSGVPGCSGEQLMRNPQLLYQLSQAAILQLRVVARTARLEDDAATACTPLPATLMACVQTCLQATGNHPALPSELVPAWMAAAAKVTAHLNQQQRTADSVLRLSGSMLQLWAVMAAKLAGAADLFTHNMVPSMPAAAELALLTLSRAAPTADGATQGDQGASSATPGLNAIQSKAAASLNAISLAFSTNEEQLGTPATAMPPELASDAVQAGVVLQLAILMAAHEQEQQHSGGASSSSLQAAGAASEAAAWAAAAGVSPSAALEYAALVRQAVAHLRGDDDSPASLLQLNMAGLQQALMARMHAVARMELSLSWQRRCKGFIAAATGTRQLVRRDGALFAPGVDPARLLLLLLQLVQQCGWQGGDVHISASVLSLIPHRLQYYTPASHPASAMHEVVRVMWMGLGRQLLRAAGRSEEEEDSSSAELAAEGSAAGAQGTVRGSIGMSTGLRVVETGELIEIPATAAGQVIDFMWPRFSICLLRSFTWLEAVYKTLAVDMFQARPHLSSQVVEAAIRVAHKKAPNTLGSIGQETEVGELAKVLHGVHVALTTCDARKYHPLPALFTRPNRATRCGSLLVSALKQLLLRPEQPGFRMVYLGYLIGASADAACAAARIWHNALSDGSIASLLSSSDIARLRGHSILASLVGGSSSSSSPAKDAMMAGAGFGTWLAITGRGLFHSGRALQLVPAVRADPVANSQQTCLNDAMQLLHVMGQHIMAIDWLVDRAGDLLAAYSHSAEQGDNIDTILINEGDALAAAAAALGPAALHALAQQGAALLDAYEPLVMQQGDAARSGSRAAQAAALATFEAACAEGGWLPQGLQALGAAVWSAFPQRFACNDPSCDNFEGLSEAASAKKCCTGCKVAHYCCKEHQLRHWPLHKSACKHLKAQQEGAPRA